MGFYVDVVADILKFPWPLFPKYKKTYTAGYRFIIPPVQKTLSWELSLPNTARYELQKVSYSLTGYKDGDSITLIKDKEFILKDVYTKELPQEKRIRPVVKVDPNHNNLIFVFKNNTGTSKVIWVDLDFACTPQVSSTYVPPPPEVTHDYDLKVTMEWDTLDLDLHAMFSNGVDVSYQNRLYTNGNNQCWLDKDDRNGGKEIITLLGKPSDKVTIYFQNWTGGVNSATVKLYKKDILIETKVITTSNIAKEKYECFVIDLNNF